VLSKTVLSKAVLRKTVLGKTALANLEAPGGAGGLEGLTVG
jgi:hypothetical protein